MVVVAAFHSTADAVCARRWHLMRIGRWWLPAVPLLLRRRQRMAVVPPPPPLGVGASRTTRIGPPAAMRPRAAVPCLAWTGDPTPAQPTPRERYVDCRSGLSEEDGNVDVHEVLLVQIEEYGLLPSWIHGL